MSDINHIKNLKVIITCGGSGGHIYPGIAIADGIRKFSPNCEILFLGAAGKMEMKIVPNCGYKIHGLNISGLYRGNLIKNLTLPYKIVASVFHSYKILKAYNPSLAIGTGGYTTVPTMLAAWMLNVRTVIHEQNAVVGLANILLSKIVDRVCVSYNSVIDKLPKHKVVFTGTPLRRLISEKDHKKHHDFFGFSPGKKCLLVLGGSLGTQSINDCLLNNIDCIIASNIQLIWITGEKYYKKILSQTSLVQDFDKSIKVYPFLEEIHKAYSTADVVISRAGAVAIAELCALQKPTIFVPSPNVVNNHQEKNVVPIISDRAAICVKDKDVNTDLIKQAIYLLNNRLDQESMMKKMKKWLHPQATDEIINHAISLVKPQ